MAKSPFFGVSGRSQAHFHAGIDRAKAQEDFRETRDITGRCLPPNGGFLRVDAKGAIALYLSR
jgi:hypothetical protein